MNTNKLKFSSNGIEESYIKSNVCYIVKDLIIDTTTHIAKFWVGSKRLVRFVNRDENYKLIENEFYEESYLQSSDIIDINDTLFLMYDDLNKTSGHFFVDCFPRLWFYEEAKLDTKIAIIFHKDKQYDPKQILDLKYKEKTIVLDRGKIYKIKEAIIPGFFVWWDDLVVPKRFVEFIDSYFQCVPNNKDSFNKLYVSRKDVDFRNKEKNCQRRILVNEDELIKKLNCSGFVSKELIPMNGMEFVNVFRNKDIVVGNEGSGMNYAILCDPNTTIVIIIHPRVNLLRNWFTQIIKYKPFNLKFIYPEIEFYDIYSTPSPNAQWKILNVEEVANRIIRYDFCR